MSKWGGLCGEFDLIELVLTRSTDGLLFSSVQTLTYTSNGSPSCQPICHRDLIYVGIKNKGAFENSLKLSSHCFLFFGSNTTNDTCRLIKVSRRAGVVAKVYVMSFASM